MAQPRVQGTVEAEAPPGLPGIVEDPPDEVFRYLDDRTGDEEDNVVFVHLRAAPLAWYWNILLLMGGLVLAILPQVRDFRRRRATRQPAE